MVFNAIKIIFFSKYTHSCCHQSKEINDYTIDMHVYLIPCTLLKSNQWCNGEHSDDHCKYNR